VPDNAFPNDPMPFFRDGAGAVDCLQRYFEREQNGSPRFTGSLLTTWAGGGEITPNEINADDLATLAFLSIRLDHRAYYWLLEGHRRELTEALRRVPTDIDLFDTDEAAVEAALGAAGAVWQVIESVPGRGWVSAGKLLARKRPRLIPVYDSVVREALGRPRAFWRPLRHWLMIDGHLQLLYSIAAEAAGREGSHVPAGLHPLRTFDIVIWMTARRAPTELEPDEADEALVG
jgi:hypothetical protein